MTKFELIREGDPMREGINEALREAALAEWDEAKALFPGSFVEKSTILVPHESGEATIVIGTAAGSKVIDGKTGNVLSNTMESEVE